jgi:hypothetical protein
MDPRTPRARNDSMLLFVCMNLRLSLATDFGLMPVAGLIHSNGRARRSALALLVGPF